MISDKWTTRVASDILTGLKFITMRRINVKNDAFCSHVATWTKKTVWEIISKKQNVYTGNISFLVVSGNHITTSTEHEQ